MLRLLLAISVVISHSSELFGFKLVGGPVAVEIFFIISGFYMSLILNEKYYGAGSYRLFLGNRLLRLLPMYWCCLLAALVLALMAHRYFGHWWLLTDSVQYFNSMSLPTFMFQAWTNFCLLGVDLVSFVGFNPATGLMFFTDDFRNTNPQFWHFLLIPQTWSLGLELTFYLLAPFLVRRSLKVMLGLIAASLAIKIFIYSALGYTEEPWSYKFFPSELSLFMLGAVAYRGYRWLEENTIPSKRHSLVIGFYLGILTSYQFVPGNEHFSNIVLNHFLYLLTAICLPFIFRSSRRWVMDTRLGEISYPVYLCHTVVFYPVSILVVHLHLQDFSVPVNIAFTLFTAWLLIRFVADPVDRLRDARVAKRVGVHSNYALALS